MTRAHPVYAHSLLNRYIVLRYIIALAGLASLASFAALPACSDPGPAVAPLAGPELTADLLYLTPAVVTPGSGTTAVFALRNLGDTQASAITCEVWLLGDDGRLVVASARKTVARLGAGETASQTLELVVPAHTAPGVYQASVLVDPDDTIGEAAEANNALAAAGALTVVARGSDVNLHPSGVRLSAASVRPDDRVVVRYTLRNTGGEPVLTGTRTRFYLSADGRASAQARWVGEQLVEGLAAGEALVLEQALLMPSDVPPGPYALLVVADGAEELAELSEDDNVASAPLELLAARVPGIDLLATGLTVTPRTVARGQSVTVRFVVKNRGDTPAPGFFNRLYLAAGATLDPIVDAPIGVTHLGALGAEAEVAMEVRALIPETTAAGSYHVAVAVDPTGVVAQANRANDVNVDALALTVSDVGHSDVSVDGATVTPSTLAAGAELTLGWRLGNAGPSAAAFFSVDLVLAASGPGGAQRTLERVPIDTLAVGESRAMTRTLLVPADLPAGRYEARIVADADAALDDPARANNTASAGTLQLGTGPVCAPDAPNHQRPGAEPVGPGVYRDRVSCAGSPDWYRITVPQGSRLRVGTWVEGWDEEPPPIELYAAGSAIPFSGVTSRFRRYGGATTTFDLPGGEVAIQLLPPTAAPSTRYTLYVDTSPGGGTGVDLVVEDVGELLSGDPGGNLETSVAFRNLGTAPAPPFDFALSLVPAGPPCTEEVALGILAGPALAAGSRDEAPVRSPLPLGTCLGDYHLRVALDPLRRISQAHTDNDVLTSFHLFRVGPPRGCVDDAFEPNDDPTLARTLVAGSYPDLVSCYLDDDWFRVYLAAGELLEVLLAPSVSASSGGPMLELYHADGSNLGVPYPWRPRADATYVATSAEAVLIRVRADYRFAAVPYRLTIAGGTGVDLVARELSASPRRQLAGEDLSLRFTVENQLPLTSVATVAEVRLRNAATWRTLASVPVPPLGATAPDGRQKAYYVKVRLPAELAAGAHELRLVVDPDGLVAEAFKHNNEVSFEGFEVLAP